MAEYNYDYHCPCGYRSDLDGLKRHQRTCATIRAATAVEEVPRSEYTTKDSGARAEYPTGMVRDTDKQKARFDLLLAEGIPYREQFATRVADLAYRGGQKYGARNHEKSRTKEELDRMKSSAYRHLVQWIAGETDEDHAAAVAMNLFMAESCRWRMENE